MSALLEQQLEIEKAEHDQKSLVAQDWLASASTAHGFNVAMTLNFEADYSSKCKDIDHRLLAANIVKHGLLRMSRKVYGKRSNQRLQVIATAERGKHIMSGDTGQLHYHLAVKIPDTMSIDEFRQKAFEAWSSVKGASKAVDRFDCKEMIDGGWMNYITKTIHSLNFESIDSTNSNF